MAVPRIAPTHVERPFDVAELFFSTTDRKGVIVSGNDVFARVSGWSEPELTGEPHNIIRHPDMPRAVFRLLWEYLESGRPIAAYVKNMAKDGAFYWVLATVAPLAEGYLSIRLKPTSELLPAVEALYAELVGIEHEIERGGGKPAEAMAASGERLGERLAQLGFAKYDDFMHVAVATEMRARRAAMGVRASSGAVHTVARQVDVREAAAALSRYRYRQFEILEQYEHLHEVFRGKTDSVLQLADNVRLFSLNSQIGAARLGDAGAALGVIADIMRMRSDATANLVRDMSNGIAGIVDELGALSFNLSIATLQSDMTAQFIQELGTHEAGTGHALLTANIDALSEGLRNGVGPSLASLGALARHLDGIIATLELLRSELRQLDALQVAGRVESARLAEAGAFRVLFEEIRAQITSAREEMEGLHVVEAIRDATLDATADVGITHALDRLDAWASSVTGTGSAAASAA